MLALCFVLLYIVKRHSPEVWSCNTLKKKLFDNLWWLIYTMSYKRVFGAKTRKVATRKPAKRWFCRVFAWRHFASPGKDTTNSSRKRNAWNVAYFRVAGRKVVMWKHEKVTIWRVFAWRPFAFSPLFVVNLSGGAKGRHATTRQMVILAGFRVATFRPARQRYDKQEAKRRRQAKIRQTGGKKATPNGDFFVFSHGDLSPRHTKVRDIPCVAFLATVCRIFAWRGERSPRKHDYTTWHKSATIKTCFFSCCRRMWGIAVYLVVP